MCFVYLTSSFRINCIQNSDNESDSKADLTEILCILFNLMSSFASDCKKSSTDEMILRMLRDLKNDVSVNVLLKADVLATESRAAVKIRSLSLRSVSCCTRPHVFTSLAQLKKFQLG